MFKNIFKWNKEDKEKIEKKVDNESLLKKDEQEDEEEKIEKKPTLSFLDKLKAGLDKTRKGMTDRIDSILKSYGKIDEELFDDLEEILVTADVGINTTMKITEGLKERVKKEKITEPKMVKKLLKEE